MGPPTGTGKRTASETSASEPAQDDSLPKRTKVANDEGNADFDEEAIDEQDEEDGAGEDDGGESDGEEEYKVLKDDEIEGV